MDVQVLETQLAHLYTMRYLGLAGTVILAYDSLLTFSEEARLVWPAIIFVLRQRTRFKHNVANTSGYRLQKEREGSRPSQLIPKLFFICMKTIMLGVASAYLLALHSPAIRDDSWCQTTLTTVGRADTVIEVLASGVIIYRLYLLWNFGHLWSRVLGASFFIMKGVTFSFSFASIGRVKVVYVSLGSIQFCDITSMPRKFMLLSWVPAAMFDVFAFVLLLINALSRPRTESERLMDIIYRDGIVFFLTTFTMRLFNVILVSVAQDPAIFWLGVVFSGTMVTVAATRSFLRLFYFGNPRDGANVVECEHGHWLMDESRSGLCPDCSYGGGNSMQIELTRVEAH